MDEVRVDAVRTAGTHVVWLVLPRPGQPGLPTNGHVSADGQRYYPVLKGACPGLEGISRAPLESPHCLSALPLPFWTPP